MIPPAEIAKAEAVLDPRIGILRELIKHDPVGQTEPFQLGYRLAAVHVLHQIENTVQEDELWSGHPIGAAVADTRRAFGL